MDTGIFSLRNRDGLTIVGNYSPADNGETVFILHGLSGARRQPHIQTLTETFAAQGIGTVVFDAANSFGDSEGDLSGASMTRHAADLEDVIGHALSQGWCHAPFYLAGHSLGGGAVLSYALKYPERVKAIVPHAAVLSQALWMAAIDRATPERLDAWRKRGYEEKEDRMNPGRFGRTSWALMEDMASHDFLARAAALSMPTLMIVGEKDEPTPPDHQRLFFDALTCDKEFHVVAGAEHTFRQPEHLAQLRDIITRWLQRQLSPVR